MPFPPAFIFPFRPARSSRSWLRDRGPSKIRGKKLSYGFLEGGALVFEILDFLLHFSLLLFRLERLSHAKSDGALIERLIGLDGHPDLISDPH